MRETHTGVAYFFWEHVPTSPIVCSYIRCVIPTFLPSFSAPTGSDRRGGCSSGDPARDGRDGPDPRGQLSVPIWCTGE